MSEQALAAALQAALGDEAKEVIGEVVTDDVAVATETETAEGKVAADAAFDIDESEIEARSKGWDPDKDAYEKRTGKRWSSAETFLAKRELSDEVSRRGKELKAVNKRLEQMQKQMDDRVAAEVKRQVDALKKERADAIREQDFEEIERLDTAIEEAKKTPAVATVDDQDEDDRPLPGSGYIESPAQVARHVEKWKRETAPWFDKSNDAIKAEALRLETVYMHSFPNSSIEDSLAHVQSVMTQRFPELGAIGKKIQTGGAPRGGGGGASVDESSLSVADKQILRVMEKSGAFKDPKDKAAFIRETFGA